MAHATKMDQDPRPEVTDAIVRWLEGHGLLERYGPVEDWNALHRRLGVPATHIESVGFG